MGGGRRGDYGVDAPYVPLLLSVGGLALGCGRGVVVLRAAQLLPEGRAVGVDLWSRTDQSGNRERTTLGNAHEKG